MSTYGKLFLYSFFAMVGASTAHAMMEGQVVPAQREVLTQSEHHRVISDMRAYMHSDDFRKRVQEHISWEPENLFPHMGGAIVAVQGELNLEEVLPPAFVNAQIFILARHLQTYRLPPTQEERAKGFKEGILVPEGLAPTIVNSVSDLFDRAFFPFSSQQEGFEKFISENSKRVVPGSLRKNPNGFWVVNVVLPHE